MTDCYFAAHECVRCEILAPSSFVIIIIIIIIIIIMIIKTLF